MKATNDALMTKVREYLDDYQDTTGYDNHDMTMLGERYATDIIALVRADERKRIREALSEYANGFVVARTDSGEEIGAFGTLPVFQQIMEQAGLTEDES